MKQSTKTIVYWTVRTNKSWKVVWIVVCALVDSDSSSKKDKRKEIEGRKNTWNCVDSHSDRSQTCFQCVQKLPPKRHPIYIIMVNLLLFLSLIQNIYTYIYINININANFCWSSWFHWDFFFLVLNLSSASLTSYQILCRYYCRSRQQALFTHSRGYFTKYICVRLYNRITKQMAVVEWIWRKQQKKKNCLYVHRSNFESFNRIN